MRECADTDRPLLCMLDVSERSGEGGRNPLGVLNGEREPLYDGLVGVTGSNPRVLLAVRCREENVDWCKDELGLTSGPETDLFFASLGSRRSCRALRATDAVRPECVLETVRDTCLGVVTGIVALGRGLRPSPRLSRSFFFLATGVFSSIALNEDVLRPEGAEELLRLDMLLPRPDGNP